MDKEILISTDFGEILDTLTGIDIDIFKEGMYYWHQGQSYEILSIRSLYIEGKLISNITLDSKRIKSLSKPFRTKLCWMGYINEDLASIEIPEDHRNE